jgi:hypothetical protein
MRPLVLSDQTAPANKAQLHEICWNCHRRSQLTRSIRSRHLNPSQFRHAARLVRTAVLGTNIISYFLQNSGQQANSLNCGHSIRYTPRFSNPQAVSARYIEPGKSDLPGSPDSDPSHLAFHFGGILVSSQPNDQMELAAWQPQHPLHACCF